MQNLYALPRKALRALNRFVGPAAASTMLLAASIHTAHAQAGPFTYQGFLDVQGAPANGVYDFSFTLHDLPSGGSALSPAVDANSVGLSNGLFTVSLDFPPSVFTGTPLWLNIAVRTNGAGAFTPLNPRQPLTPAPYALRAARAGVADGLSGSVDIPGTITARQFVGSGSGLTNLNSALVRLSSLDASDGTPANALQVDDTGRVGIGAPAPLRGKLDVAGGPVVVDNGQGFFTLDAARGATAAGIDGSNDGALRITAGGQRRAHLTPAGNLGIGTTTPSTRLSLGTDSVLEKFALVDAAAGRTTGFGVSNNTFRLHLGSASTRFGIYSDSTAPTPMVAVNKDGSMDFNNNNNGAKRVGIGSPAGSPFNGAVTVHDASGVERASMIVDSAGKGKLTCDYIQINGGADIAEPFEIRDDPKIRPGMVVAIDPQSMGELRLSDRAYDPTVVGIISGAQGISPGLMLQQKGTPATGRHPVALTGRVWCYCDADAGGPIQPGDLLTSANVPGHAMKASDRQRAPGAVLGKAMSALPQGRGLVLILVSLQ